MKAIVYLELRGEKPSKAQIECVSLASQVADETTVVCASQPTQTQQNDLSAFGANRFLVASAFGTADAIKNARALAQICKSEQAGLLMLSHDYSGKAIAPAAAALLGAGMASGIISLSVVGNSLSARKPVFSGKAFTQISLNGPVSVVTLVQNSVAPVPNQKTATIVSFDGNAEATSMNLVQHKPKGSGGLVLTEAERVVSAGRGMKGPENWGMIEELAAELGAATACSRPVADIHWRPHHEHVGQTGITIRPNLYIAVGISGAIQHLAGVNGSKVIVVINTDKEAPFFKSADYGIVGDAFDVVPKMIAAIKKLKAETL